MPLYVSSAHPIEKLQQASRDKFTSLFSIMASLCVEAGRSDLLTTKKDNPFTEVLKATFAFSGEREGKLDEDAGKALTAFLKDKATQIKAHRVLLQLALLAKQYEALAAGMFMSAPGFVRIASPLYARASPLSPPFSSALSIVLVLLCVRTAVEGQLVDVNESFPLLEEPAVPPLDESAKRVDGASGPKKRARAGTGGTSAPARGAKGPRSGAAAVLAQTGHGQNPITNGEGSGDVDAAPEATVAAPAPAASPAAPAASPATPAAPATSPAAVVLDDGIGASPQLFFLDAYGCEQGPYCSSVFKQWLAYGHIWPTTQVRQGTDPAEAASYRPLQEVMAQFDAKEIAS